MSVLGNYEIAGAPRYIHGNFAPSGAIIKARDLIQIMWKNKFGVGLFL